jgi:hypothetical protein
VSEVIRVLAVVAVVGYVIGRQLMGEPLRGKRVVVLPVVLAVAGAADLGKNGHHVRPADVAFLVISGLIAVTIGVLQGRMMRLEPRNGALWGQMPARARWRWAVLAGSRLIVTLIALAVGAKVAGSSAPIIMLLGISRPGQAAIVMRHALATGIPFAPEKDGTSFLSGQISGMGSRPPGPASQYPPQHGPTHHPAGWPPASGPDSQPEADPVRYLHRVPPPAGDTETPAQPESGPAQASPHGGVAPDLATLAHLTAELMARRQRRQRRRPGRGR